MAVITHYETLKVSRNASEDVIRAAYRALAQKYHPDRNMNDPEAVLAMQLINIAYNTLTDVKKRVEHDGWIDSQTPKPKPPPAAAPVSPEERAKREKALNEITAWEAFAAKEQKEAETSRAKATKAAEQAAAASPADRPKWDAYAKQAAAEAAAAEAKAANTTKYANEKIAAIGIKPDAPEAGPKKIQTHYDTLAVARDAPVEVIKAVHKMLALKYQAGESGPTAETTQMTQILNNAYQILTDPVQRAEHDAWISAQEPKKDSFFVAAAPRKATAREVEAQALAQKLAKDAVNFAAAAEQAAALAREAEARAAKAKSDAAPHATGKDADKWAAFVAKAVAAAKEAQDRATRAAEKAKAEQERAQQAADQATHERELATRDAAEKAEEAERTRKLWDKN